jgi:hypothetical protein
LPWRKRVRSRHARPRTCGGEQGVVVAVVGRAAEPATATGPRAPPAEERGLLQYRTGRRRDTAEYGALRGDLVMLRTTSTAVRPVPSRTTVSSGGSAESTRVAHGIMNGRGNRSIARRAASSAAGWVPGGAGRGCRPEEDGGRRPSPSTGVLAAHGVDEDPLGNFSSVTPGAAAVSRRRRSVSRRYSP